MKPKTIKQYQKQVEELKTLLSYLVNENTILPPLNDKGWYEIKTSIHPYEYTKIQKHLKEGN